MPKKHKTNHSKTKKTVGINQLESFPGVFNGKEDRKQDKLIKMDDDIKSELISKKISTIDISE